MKNKSNSIWREVSEIQVYGRGYGPALGFFKPFGFTQGEEYFWAARRQFVS
jgi:hypothetical protein